MAELAAKLHAIPIFADVSPADLQQLASKAATRDFAAGEQVIVQGTEGDEFFVTESGEYEVFLSEPTVGIERELRRLGAGAHFGEISVISGRPRSSSIRAVTSGRCQVFHQSHVRELIGSSKDFALAMCRGMAVYIEDASRREASVYRFVDLDELSGLEETVPLLAPNLCDTFSALVIGRDGDALTVAMVDPYQKDVRDFIGSVLGGYRIEFVAMSPDDFSRFRSLHGSAAPAETFDDAALTVIDSKGEAATLDDSDASDLLRRALLSAVHGRGSDVHLEPSGGPDGGGRVRIRIDGRVVDAKLGDDVAVTAERISKTVNRLKVIGELDITEKRLPQDGRFSANLGDRRIDLRLSVLPCQGGEKAVLRIADPDRRIADLDQLIPSKPISMLVNDIFSSPSGLVLVTGPTGSGKTSTLYAGLEGIWARSNAINVVTIEDPIEHDLAFATQTQVNRAAGLEFAQILRSVLRQDPDVILVGEIRDAESAEIATEAGSTGHLVLSSLHTHSAIESVTRLRQLGVPAYQIGSALRGVLSQRLVARNCRSCVAPLQGAAATSLTERLRDRGVLEAGASLELRAGAGCDQCGGTGAFGRVALFEVLAVGEALAELIDRDAGAGELRAALGSGTFVSMGSYARFLLEQGVVNPEALCRALPQKLAFT